MIPKKIHYCWFGPKPFPKLVLKCIETWKVHLPEYEFYLWNESNSPMEIPFVKAAYAAKKYAFVSDYVRFWALYNEGGVYLDTDMFLVRSLDNLLNNICFFGWETLEEDVVGCCVIGSTRNDDFIKIILDNYNVLNFNLEDIDKLVIPRLITPLYINYIQKEEINIYPFDYFYPFPYLKRDDISKFNTYATENTYAIHLWNLSWVSTVDKFIYKLVRIVKRIKF
ncbi:MAG: polysaccharide biosynthesis protein [Paludibacter sp.]|nr:polysaccharide biosynthesis protein [Paludibacter sp.]